MNRTVAIIALSAVFLSFLGCSKGEEPNFDDQKSRITAYIDKLNLEDENIAYDEQLYLNSGVYRIHFERGETGGNPTEKMILPGDSLEYWFIGQYFTSEPSGVFYSNVFSVLQDLALQGLDISYWKNTVEKAKLGSTPMIKGLRRGLEGCIEGDSIMLLLTSNLAHGDREIAGLPENSTVSFNIRITKVKKQE